MEEMYYYLMLTEEAKKATLTPEERHYFNQFLRGTAELAD